MTNNRSTATAFPPFVVRSDRIPIPFSPDGAKHSSFGVRHDASERKARTSAPVAAARLSRPVAPARWQGGNIMVPRDLEVPPEWMIVAAAA